MSKSSSALKEESNEIEIETEAEVEAEAEANAEHEVEMNSDNSGDSSNITGPKLELGNYEIKENTSQKIKSHYEPSSQEIDGTDSSSDLKNYIVGFNGEEYIQIEDSCLIGLDPTANYTLKDIHSSPKICKFYRHNQQLYIFPLQNKTEIKIQSKIIKAGKLHLLKYKDSIFIEYNKLDIYPEIPLILEDPEEMARKRKEREEEFNKAIGFNKGQDGKKTEDEKDKKNKNKKESLPLRQQITLLFTEIKDAITNGFTSFFDNLFFTNLLLSNPKIQLASSFRRIPALILDLMLATGLHFALLHLKIKEYLSISHNFNIDFITTIAPIFSPLGKSHSNVIISSLKTQVDIVPLLMFLALQVSFTLILGNTLFSFILGIRSHGNLIFNRTIGVLRCIFGLITLPLIIFDIPLLMNIPTVKEILFRSPFIINIKEKKVLEKETQDNGEKLKEGEEDKENNDKEKDKKEDDENKNKDGENAEQEAELIEEQVTIEEEIQEILTIPNRLQIMQMYTRENLNKNIVTSKLLTIYDKFINLFSGLLLINIYNKKNNFKFPDFSTRFFSLSLDIAVPTIFCKFVIVNNYFAIIPADILKEYLNTNSLVTTYIYNFYSNVIFHANNILHISLSFDRYYNFLLTTLPPLPIILFYIIFNLLLGVSLFQFIFGIRSSTNSFIFKRIVGPIRAAIGLTLLPYLLFELPIILRTPSLKEILTRSALVQYYKKI